MYLKFFVLLQSNAGYSPNADTANSLAYLGQAVFSVVVFVFVVVLAYYSTKLIASAKILKQGGNNVRLIERVALSQTTSVQLIKAGEKYVLIGVAKDHVSFLSEINKDEVVITEAEPFAPKIPFQNVLNQFLRKKDN